ncbi:MAG: hypothetical protein JSV88_09525, partial [Candidatus Aminicenantes bacterium]
MARPALLIGLGGTGQWVLNYVKKELLDNTKGEGIPKEVRLVAFDTTPQIDEVKSKPDEEEPIVVEGVQLDFREFYHLGGNIERIVREIAEKNMHPHISSWLQAKTYLTRLGKGQYMLEEGAGQMRPFGRMAVFKDLESNPENSKIFSTLRNAIQDIRTQITENRSLEISIIASLAGGTGAGMAIDVAQIVRTIAEDTIRSRNFIIRGFFVTPRAFHFIPGGDDSEMRARAFAAIRELSRFITVFGNREYPMIYNAHPQFREILQRPVKKRLFDLCYLVDPHRVRNSLDVVEPKFGIFPSISDAMLALLDEKSGQQHTEHVNNMMPHLVRGDDVAYFSAIGTYSFVLPIREIIEENAGKLAIDFLKRLVTPQLDAQGRVIGLSSDKNQEMPNKRGSDLVEIFMKESYSIERMGGNLFFSQAAKLLEQGGIRNNQLLEQVAGLSNVEWLTFIEPDDATEEIRDLRTEVRSILDHRLSKDVKTSREIKEKPEFGCERIEKEVELYSIKYLGRKQPDGNTTGGKFREGLDRYASLQIRRFQKAMAQYCIKLLNGTSETELELSKSGKLGFIQEFLDGLSIQLEEFCKFMERVGEIRRREGQLTLKREEVRLARDQMFKDRKKSGLFQNRADVSQRQFLMLMEEQVELEKNEMVFNYVSQTALQYRDHSFLLKGTIDDWAKALVLGTAEQASLHEALNKNLELVKAKRMRRKNFARVRREETDDEYEQKLYQRFAEDNLIDIFRGVKWKLNEDEKTVELEVLGEELLCRKTRERERPTEHNVAIILEKTRGTFQRLIQEEIISRHLMYRYHEEDLGNRFYENGSPLVNFSVVPRFGQPSNFLAVKHGIIEGDEPYFRDVVEKISEKSGVKGQRAMLVQSDNAHKCTLLYSIDVINADCLTSYEELATAYKQFWDDRRLLHVFPAEVNAVYYEQQVQQKLQKKYRLFHPRIVYMLEYKDWVLQFTRCRVYDLIKITKDEKGNRFWGLHLPECQHKGKKYNAEVIELTPHKVKKPDLLHAMDTFVFRRKDVRLEFEIPIQYDHLDKSLVLAKKQVGNAVANVDKINSIIETGFIRDLKVSKEQFERDLGDLMHVMLLEEIDRFGIGPTGQEIDEPADQEIETYHMALVVSPKEIAVGQRLTLRVEIRPGALEKNSFQLSKDIRELYCFVNADGLQLVGDEAAAIPRDPNTGQPVPMEFELQGHVRGKQTFTVELFIEDHESKRLRIIKSGSQVTVAAPKPTQEPQPILPQIDIR